MYVLGFIFVVAIPRVACTVVQIANMRRCGACSAWSVSLSNLLSSKPPPESTVDSEKQQKNLLRDTFTSISDAHIAGPSKDSPPPPRSQKGARSTSRPISMLQPYTPPRVSVERETLPELQPIFNFMNNHSEKLYTEGYFLKLADLMPGMSTGRDGYPSRN